ncbi:MAG: UDP-glucose 4-epimerase GalE [Phycisphaerae bacterium]
MNIFVTGGAGYVGSHCIRALLDAGHQVSVYDNLTRGHRAAVDQRAELAEGDLGDTARLKATLSGGGFDAVMHFAAWAEVGESVTDPLRYYRNNVANTIGLLEAMREHDIRNIVFSSTCATYGIPSSVPISEDVAQRPINPYGRTKLAIEWALQDCAVAWGLGATALRYFNAAGASADGKIGEDHEPESHLIPIVLQVALGQRDEVKIFGVDYPTADGTCVRDYIHVEDLATVHRMAIEAQAEGMFRFYNVGTGQGVSVKEVIEACRRVTGHDIPAVPAPRREGDPPELYADPTRIMTALDWQPQYTDIRRTVETAWQWHRAHPDGF